LLVFLNLIYTSIYVYLVKFWFFMSSF